MSVRCDQCGKSDGVVQEAWICDPGDQPIMAWLHRECEAAFSERLGSARALGEITDILNELPAADAA
jgi:hypothetical protein